MHFIPNGIFYLDFSLQICLRFLQKQKCIKKIINFKKSKQMKKLEISQMENLQGGNGIKGCYVVAAVLWIFATPLVAGAVALGCAAADY